MSEADLKAELEAIEARRRARAEKRPPPPTELERKVAESKRLDALEAALAEAEEKHGKLGQGVAVVHCKYADGTLLGSVIVKRPNAAYWTKFQGALADLEGQKRDEKIAQLWQHARVWPDVGAVETLITELPNTPVRLMSAISLLAGDHEEEVQGKS